MKRLFAAALAALAFAFTAGTATVASAHDQDKPSFPMKAADFQKRIDGRLEKMKTRLESRIKDKAMPDAQAKELRDRFAAGATKVNAAAKTATADGVVTEDEAKAVRAAFREMKPHHKGGHGHKDRSAKKS